ncbi:ABC transporter ATP-binding protein [Paenibacillus pasadenensis]|uniref:ABC transporter ATP-binding protein n=1 Tax=Paenibacillus pasadenensis TaxID=217090 RepID=UPI00203B0EB8|nr:ABC transporter ATP-binding protein [Paenibacillus pasadenensis]MCM3747452.1 ABC transporter ATP-binding protein [Paenibacillus pasadenensis]
MDYTKHREAIERMYNDLATISRMVTTTKPNGAKQQGLVQIYADQPCFLSAGAAAANTQTDNQNDIRASMKLFIAPEVEIRQGDEIVISRFGAPHRIWRYNAGEPLPPYPTHQEVELLREDYA